MDDLDGIRWIAYLFQGFYTINISLQGDIVMCNLYPLCFIHLEMKTWDAEARTTMKCSNQNAQISLAANSLVLAAVFYQR